MYSVNAPLPGRVHQLVYELAPELAGFDRIRDEPTLVVKRLGDQSIDTIDAMIDRVRRALHGAPAVEARVAELGVFEQPPNGPVPVVYLAVESQGLRILHRRLATVVDPVAGLEGDDYVPHVTLARGGDRDAAARLDGRGVGPVTWTIGALHVWDARHGERVGEIRLPASG